jgi:O-antigen/teichoic acid export membrane protein
MQLLGLAFLPFFVSSPFPFLFTALHRQRFLMVSSLFALGMRIGLNFLLIPFYGYLGPCLAFFASETVMVIVCIAKLDRLGLPLALTQIVWRPLLACVCIGVGLFLIRNASILWLVPAAAGGLVLYFVMLFLLGAFSASDLRLAKEGLGFLKPFLAKWSGQPVVLK